MRQRMRRAAGTTGRVVFGDQRRIGLWIVPLMAIVALAAAVVAAGVTILVYSQRVEALREEVGGAGTAAQEARSEIEALVEEFAADLAPTEEVTAAGDAPSTQGPNAAGVFATAAPDGTVGNAFVFFSDDAQSFLVTAESAIAGSTQVEVYLPDGVRAAEVVQVDAEWGLATLRLDVPDIAPLRWRGPGDDLEPPMAGRILGVAGPDTPVEVPVEIVGVGGRGLVLDAATSQYLSGAPVLDLHGQVVAVLTTAYEPFGPADGTLAHVPPIRAICVRMVTCAPEDLGGRPALAPAPTRVPAPLAPGRGPTPTPRPS